MSGSISAYTHIATAAAQHARYGWKTHAMSMPVSARPTPGQHEGAERVGRADVAADSSAGRSTPRIAVTERECDITLSIDVEPRRGVVELDEAGEGRLPGEQHRRAVGEQRRPARRAAASAHGQRRPRQASTSPATAPTATTARPPARSR